MDAVGLEQAPVARDIGEEEGVEGRAVAPCQLGEDAVIFGAISAAEIGRGEHAGDEDRDAAPLQLGEDRVEIGAGPGGRQAAQHVVGAKRKDDEIGLLPEAVQSPAQPRAARRRRVARDSAIDHECRDAVAAQHVLELGDESLARRQAVAGGEAVAQSEDPDRPRLRRRRHCEAGQQGRVDKPPGDAIWQQQPHRISLPFMTSPYVIDAADVILSLGAGAGRVDILRGVDLKVARGESVALLGPSGSGKSSLMAVLAGLEQATSGRIRIAGEDFTALGEDALARARRGRIGIILQAFHLLPTMNALENVAVPLELTGEADAFAAAEAELAAVGLGHRLGHYPAQLSGGEQQRVAIARATAPKPALILADEPTGNLDAATGASILDLLFERRAETGATLLVITHDPALAGRCGRVLEMQDGRIVGDKG